MIRSLQHSAEWVPEHAEANADALSRSAAAPPPDFLKNYEVVARAA